VRPKNFYVNLRLCTNGGMYHAVRTVPLVDGTETQIVRFRRLNKPIFCCLTEYFFSRQETTARKKEDISSQGLSGNHDPRALAQAFQSPTPPSTIFLFAFSPHLIHSTILTMDEKQHTQSKS